MSLEPGTEFAGYRVVRRIGAGGMGEVYLVRHPRLPRHDVIKVLAEQVSNDPIFRARFTREADLAAQLDHPCIVSVYDRGEVDGRLWISMQYVPGTDAAALLATSPGGLPLADVAAVGDAIGAALDHAHRSGLLHRDVKPANILISPGESDPRLPQHVTRRRIRLADFGIARPTDGGATSLTSTDLVIGSFPYSSPEQLSAETLDARSDVYSLACSLFELIAGTVPFTARTPAMMIHHHLSTPPPELSDLRPDVPPALPPTAFAPTAAIPVAGATQPGDDGPRPTIARGATAYSGLPGHAVPQHDPGSSTVRASRDLPVLDPPRPGPGATRRTTASLACGVAAIPLSVVGGLGLPVGVAGWYLAGRGQPGSAGRFARMLCVLGVVLSLGFIAFTVGRAVAMQF